MFLSASEEVAIETFCDALPAIFGKCSEGSSILFLNGEKGSMLPALKSEHAWVSADNSTGVKVCLEDQVDSIIDQLN